MMTALFSTDKKLGMFVWDVHHENSGFDDAELNQAYARFLYSSVPKARSLAKQQLLRRLHVEAELIDIVPDDFCKLNWYSEHWKTLS
jgi:hypothetical protein